MLDTMFEFIKHLSTVICFSNKRRACPKVSSLCFQSRLGKASIKRKTQKKLAVLKRTKSYTRAVAFTLSLPLSAFLFAFSALRSRVFHSLSLSGAVGQWRHTR